MDKKLYWNPNRLLSFNRLFNFVVGNRGGGKTYGMKNLVISRFLRKGEQFVYVRRYGNEFGVLREFFADIKKEYPDHTFDAKGNTMGSYGYYIIDGKTAGFAIPLSVSAKFKSNSFPDVTTIIFDEFIIERGRISYLKDEVTLFLDLYETIARTRDVRVVFLSNALSMYNPYFVYFGIRNQKGAHFVRQEEICVEFVDNPEFKEEKYKTRFGKLISNTRYGDYAIDNKFFLDNNQFVEKKTGVCIPWCKIIVANEDYSLWYGRDTGYLYFVKDEVPDNLPVYCVMTEDHQPNVFLIKRIKTDKIFQGVRDAYESSNMRFDSITSKSVFYEIMQYI